MIGYRSNVYAICYMSMVIRVADDRSWLLTVIRDETRRRIRNLTADDVSYVKIIISNWHIIRANRMNFSDRDEPAAGNP